MLIASSPATVWKNATSSASQSRRLAERIFSTPTNRFAPRIIIGIEACEV